MNYLDLLNDPDASLTRGGPGMFPGANDYKERIRELLERVNAGSKKREGKPVPAAGTGDLPEHLQRLLDDVFPGVKDRYAAGDVRVSKNRGTAFGYSRDPRTGLVVRRSEQDTLSELNRLTSQKGLLRSQLRQEHDEKYADWKALMSANQLSSGDIQFDPRMSPSALRSQIAAYVEQNRSRKEEASQRFIYNQLANAPWLKGKLPEFDAIKSGGTEGIRMLIGQAEEAEKRMKQEGMQAGMQQIMESGDPEALPKLIGSLASKYDVGLATQMAMQIYQGHQRSTEQTRAEESELERVRLKGEYDIQKSDMEAKEKRREEGMKQNRERLESDVYDPLRKVSSSVYVPGADEGDIQQRSGVPSGKKIAHLNQKIAQIRQVKDQITSLFGEKHARDLFFQAMEETRAALNKGREGANAKSLMKSGVISPDPGQYIDTNTIFAAPSADVIGDPSSDEFLSILAEKLLRFLNPSWYSEE